MLFFVWYALLYVHYSFAIILTRKRELVVLPLLPFGCLVTVNFLWFFPTVLWVGLQGVIFPNHTHLLFVIDSAVFKTQKMFCWYGGLLTYAIIITKKQSIAKSLISQQS